MVEKAVVNAVERPTARTVVDMIDTSALCRVTRIVRAQDPLLEIAGIATNRDITLMNAGITRKAPTIAVTRAVENSPKVENADVAEDAD